MKAAAILLILGRAPGTSSHSHRHGKAAGSSSPPDVWLPVGLAITLSLSQPLQQRATTFADMYIYTVTTVWWHRVYTFSSGTGAL